MWKARRVLLTRLIVWREYQASNSPIAETDLAHAASAELIIWQTSVPDRTTAGTDSSASHELR